MGRKGGGEKGWQTGNQSPPFTSRQIPRQSLSSSCFGSQPLPSLFLLPIPQFLLLSMILQGMEYSFGPFRSSVVPVCPPSLLPAPSLFADGGRQGWQLTVRVCGEWLDTVQAPFSSSHWGLFSTGFATNPKDSATWAAMKNVNSIPARWYTCTFSVSSEIWWQRELIFSLEVQNGTVNRQEKSTLLLSMSQIVLFWKAACT